jgi:uncharacterized protein (UPF0212 family)
MVPVSTDTQEPEEEQGTFCPSCGEKLYSVYAARSVELEYDGKIWFEKNVFSGSVGCPHCNEELDQETCKELGIPPEWY